MMTVMIKVPLSHYYACGPFGY